MLGHGRCTYTRLNNDMFTTLNLCLILIAFDLGNPNNGDMLGNPNNGRWKQMMHGRKHGPNQEFLQPLCYRCTQPRLMLLVQVYLPAKNTK